MTLTFPDWAELSRYVYLAIGSAVLILLSAGLYYAPIARSKVPAILLGIVGGAGLGAGIAVIAMMGYGWRWYAQYYENSNPRLSGGEPPPMGGGGRPRGGGQRGTGFNSKNQLASLITKLDLLTHERPAVKLDIEQKRKIREQIQKLEDNEALGEDEAQKRLDAVVEILHDDQKQILSEAGVNLPGQRSGNRGGGDAPANPFKEGPPYQHLKSLRDQLKDAKTE